MNSFIIIILVIKICEEKKKKNIYKNLAHDETLNRQLSAYERGVLTDDTTETSTFRSENVNYKHHVLDEQIALCSCEEVDVGCK